MTSPVAAQARILAELREKLKADHGMNDGDQALEDTLEGASDLPEMLASMARKAKRAESFADALYPIIRENQERRARLERQAKSLRNQITWALEEAGMKTLTLPDMTMSLSEGEAPLSVEDDLVPPPYLVPHYSPDKKAIRAALEEGEVFAFARLGNARPKLTIRTR